MFVLKILTITCAVLSCAETRVKHNERRLVLHSSDDLALEAQLLRQELNTLKQGFTVGAPYNIDGGAGKYLYLPQNPTWAKYVDGIQDIGEYISSTEYEIYKDIFSPFPQNMHDQDATCALCRSPKPTTVMIQCKTDYYSGWTREYTGYLMTNRKDHISASDYACVDVKAEAVYHGQANLNGKLCYFTEVKCGLLPCQEYPDRRELACVVCSK